MHWSMWTGCEIVEGRQVPYRKQDIYKHDSSRFREAIKNTPHHWKNTRLPHCKKYILQLLAKQESVNPMLRHLASRPEPLAISARPAGG